jgi:3'-5' exoribonuclease
MWDDVAAAVEILQHADAVHVTGTFHRHLRYGPQVTIRSLAIPIDVDWDVLLDGPRIPVAELERRLDSLLSSLDDGYLSELGEALLGPTSAVGRAYRRAFAAKYNHHAYSSGLLEHSLEVAALVDHAVQVLGRVDRDLAVCGALLHDIGKLDAYSGDRHAVELNDQGKLIGEIPAGYYAVRRAIEAIPSFPPGLAQALLHIILSHHGCLEHGSPVLPSTREALVVHVMDKLSGDLGSFDRLQRETAEDESWSRFDRALGRSVRIADRSSSEKPKSS